MKKLKYTKEEWDIIKKWGIPSDRDYDTSRMVFAPDGKTRISSLILAKQRRDILEKAGLELIRDNNFKKTG